MLIRNCDSWPHHYAMCIKIKRLTLKNTGCMLTWMYCNSFRKHEAIKELHKKLFLSNFYFVYVAIIKWQKNAILSLKLQGCGNVTKKFEILWLLFLTFFMSLKFFMGFWVLDGFCWLYLVESKFHWFLFKTINCLLVSMLNVY